MIRISSDVDLFRAVQYRRRNRDDLRREAGGRAAKFPPDGAASVCGDGGEKSLAVGGDPLLAASFYSLLILFSWAPVSVVIPASASNYIVGTFGAKYLLKEDVSFKRWMGVVMVCLGVTLVLLTGRG